MLMSPRLGWWFAAGAVLLTAAAIAIGIDSESPVAGFVVVLALVWLAASACVLAWRIWR
jgi:hypothetical protein